MEHVAGALWLAGVAARLYARSLVFLNVGTGWQKEEPAGALPGLEQGTDTEETKFRA